MATRVAIVNDGNFTTAATWGLVDSTSYLNAENSVESLLTTSYSDTRSQAFTPGAIEISHIGVKLCERNGTTGTMSVHLALNSDHSAVAGTEVTINTADLPAATEAGLDGGWVLLKLSSPVTLSAATAYEMEAKTSSASQVDLFCDSTVDNLSRILVTTTTGAPAAGDDLIICEEKTGAGAATTINVVMNNNDTTDYGSAPTAANSLITPGIAICDGGSLSFVTAASSELQLSNSLIVYSGGTLNIGTVATPVERGQTAKLHFDCGSNVDYGLVVRNGGTFVAQGLSRSSGKNVVSCLLNTDEAVDSTSLGVDTDTGWLDNDEIAVASTTRTYSQCEKGTLNGNAGASSLTVDGFGGTGGGLAYAHTGTSPTQAEVILLTRNIKIYGASASLQTYIYINATSTVDIDWVEFYWIGSGTSNKYGITCSTTSGSTNIQYSSLHNFEVAGSTGVYSASVLTSSSLVFSNNVTFLIAAKHFYMPTAYNANSWTADTNIFMRTIDSGEPLSLINGTSGSGSYTFSNITVVGGAASGAGFSGLKFVNDNTNATISNLTSHSHNGEGFSLNSAVSNLTISTFTAWRNSGAGISSTSNSSGTIIINIEISNVTLFGNTTNNITISGQSLIGLTLKNVTSNGDTTFSTTNGISINKPFKGSINIGDFSTVSGIKTAHTNDINIASSLSKVDFKLNNVKLGASIELLSQTNMNDSSDFVSSQKNDQTKGQHKTWKKYGTITIETTAGLYRTASPSVRLTPNSASYKLESGSFKVNVADGQTCTPSVYVRESVVGDGTDYNGNRIRLIQKRNDAIGVTADTVLATATVASEGSFEELTAATAAVTDDGVVEFVIDCDGTTGWINIDDFTATVA